MQHLRESIAWKKISNDLGNSVLILSVLWTLVCERLFFDLYKYEWPDCQLNMFIILGTRPSGELETKSHKMEFTPS